MTRDRSSWRAAADRVAGVRALRKRVRQLTSLALQLAASAQQRARAPTAYYIEMCVTSHHITPSHANANATPRACPFLLLALTRYLVCAGGRRRHRQQLTCTKDKREVTAFIPSSRSIDSIGLIQRGAVLVQKLMYLPEYRRHRGHQASSIIKFDRQL